MTIARRNALVAHISVLTGSASLAIILAVSDSLAPVLAVTTGLTTAAMLVVMLLHAVFGCCWHHSHETCTPAAVESTASAAEEQSRTDGDRCPCGHHHEGSQTPDGDEPAGGHDGCDCCGEVCQFVASSEASVPIDSGMSLDSAVAGDAASGQTALLMVSRLSRSDGPPGDPSPTKRLLTRLCVWRL